MISVSEPAPFQQQNQMFVRLTKAMSIASLLVSSVVCGIYKQPSVVWNIEIGSQG